MATKKDDTKRSDDSSKSKSEGDKQAQAARDAYLDEVKKQRDVRLQAAGLAEAPKAEGEHIKVKTVPGPGGMPRKGEGGGGMLFGPEERVVALGAITYRQYHSIMTNPLLEVAGKAPANFDGWAKG